MLPVNDKACIVGLVHISSPTAGVPPLSDVTTLSTPLGIPACSPSPASASAQRGVSSEGFTTTLQPAASAAAALRRIIVSGKFQEVMRAEGPTGCLYSNSCLSGDGGGITSP